MQGQVQIESGQGSLTIGPLKEDYINIKVESDGIVAQIRPYLYTDAEHLSSFFSDLANNWKGWDGAKTWSSIEGDLKFEAVHDHLGSINFQVELEANMGLPNEWHAMVQFKVELGSLEKLAKEIATILNS